MPDLSLEQVYASAVPFKIYRSRIQLHVQTFNTHYEHLSFIREEVKVPFPSDTRLLVLTEDWCPDSVLNLPLIARLAEATPNAHLRIADRTQYRSVADRYPGRGGVSRLPTVIFLDPNYQAKGYWSERSESAHRWMAEFIKDDPLPEISFNEGKPVPALAQWMERRFAAQFPVFYSSGWRDVRDELNKVYSEAVKHLPTNISSRA